MTEISAPSSWPAPPVSGEPIAPAACPDTLAFLARRRSSNKRLLSAPGPGREDLGELLRIAVRVPDHRRVEPWRFVIYGPEGHGELRDALIAARRSEGATDAELKDERERAERAPVTVFVISSPDRDHKTPVWEQELSCGAACHQLVLAAHAAGWGAVWLTEWMAYSEAFARQLGLAEGERIAGVILLGTAKAAPPERQRPDIAALTEWRGG